MSLSESAINRLKQVLREREAALRTKIKREWSEAERRTYSRVSGEVAGRGDQAVADWMGDIDLIELGSNVAALDETEQALERIAQGTYGLCSECGEPIGLSRLDALPTAIRCVRCQARKDERYTDVTPSL